MSNFTIHQFTLASKVSTRDTGLFTPQRGWMKTSPLRPQAKTDCCKTTGDYSDFKRITYNP